MQSNHLYKDQLEIICFASGLYSRGALLEEILTNNCSVDLAMTPFTKMEMWILSAIIPLLLASSPGEIVTNLH